MSTLSRIAASRQNGAKSLGPKTVEGKHNSSQNAVRHGLLSGMTVLKDESREQFQELHDQYIAQFQPVGGLEHDAVEEMVSAQWRLRRLRLIEKTLLDDYGTDTGKPDAAQRIALAFHRLSNSPVLSLLERYEARLTRMYQRAFKHLLLLREMRPAAEAPAQLPAVPQKAAPVRPTPPAAPGTRPNPAEPQSLRPDPGSFGNSEARPERGPILKIS